MKLYLYTLTRPVLSSGIKERGEAKAFSRQILTTACRYLLSPYTFQIRMGALYLLYALYSEQLTRPRVQVRFPILVLVSV